MQAVCGGASYTVKVCYLRMESTCAGRPPEGLTAQLGTVGWLWVDFVPRERGLGPTTVTAMVRGVPLVDLELQAAEPATAGGATAVPVAGTVPAAMELANNNLFPVVPVGGTVPPAAAHEAALFPGQLGASVVMGRPAR